MSAHPIARDRKAAFTGLILGFIALAVIVVSIVLLTNQRFAGHEAAKPAAGATP